MKIPVGWVAAYRIVTNVKPLYGLETFSELSVCVKLVGDCGIGLKFCYRYMQ